MQAAQARPHARTILSTVALWLVVSLAFGMLFAFLVSSFINHPDRWTLLTFFGLSPFILALTSARPKQYLKYPAWKIALPLFMLYILIIVGFFWYFPLALNLSGPFLTLLVAAIFVQRALHASTSGVLLLLGCGLVGGAAAALVCWLMLGPGIINLPMVLVLVLAVGLAGPAGGSLRHASNALWPRFRRSRALATVAPAPAAASASLSRREVLLGLGGLVGLAATGTGFTWLSHSLLAHAFPLVTYKSFDKVQELSWSPDGKQIVLALGERFVGGQIAIWDATTSKDVYPPSRATAPDYFTVQAVAWSPDGIRIALGGGNGLFLFDDQSNLNAAIIDATTLRPIVALSAGKAGTHAEVPAIAWSPDGTRLATASGKTQVWDAATGKQLLSIDTGLFALAWSPDGRYLVTDNQYDAQVWDVESDALVTTYRGHTNFIVTAAWSPDSAKVVTGSNDRTAQVWDARSGSHLLTYRSDAYSVKAIAWSPDGTRIASAGIGGDVHVWDATTGEQVFLYKGHSQEVNALAWSPDGTRIASGSDDETAQVWQPG